jgi:hypothetical protein
MTCPRALPCPLLLLCLACSGPDDSPCPPGEERFRDRCVDPARRYEPAAPLDRDNVVDFGLKLTQLRLPEPPRSGFRIVVPPRLMQPGEEKLYCVSWPFPALHNQVIYAGRLYTTRGLHHSNVFSRPPDKQRGRNPYPDCHRGAADPFRDLPFIIPDALFGNSTQVEGEETLAFPAGMGYRVNPENEIITNIHFLNPGSAPLQVEVAYDFFTMPAAELQTEVAPFHMSINGFRVEPGETRTIATTCDVFGGHMVSMMLHTHRLAVGGQVELLRPEQAARTVYEQGPYDSGSDIRLFSPQLQMADGDALRFSCTFHNTLDKPVTYGLGDNEMCVLFGYMYPPGKQVIAYTEDVSRPCQSFQLGLFRP